jgi:hypothetical protein
MDRKGVKRVCLALKGVTLDHPWGADHDAYKVGGKMFALTNLRFIVRHDAAASKATAGGTGTVVSWHY